MAGYELTKFSGLTDPEDFIRNFRRWCECANYDPGAGHNMRMRIHGIFENCLEGDAKDWYEGRIKNKNWELQNITANTGVVTLNAINALTNNQIRAIDVARFRVPPHSVWDEDWITSGGQPTDLAPNPPNAGNNGNVVAPSITIGQGNDPVNRFYSKLKRLIKQAYPALAEANQEELIRQQFFKRISHDNKLEVTRIGLEHPISTLIRKLEEIERRKAELMLGQYDPNSHPVTSHSRSTANTKDSYITSNTGITETEVRNLVKSMMLSEQSQPISTQLAPQQIQPPQPSQLSQPSQPSQLSKPYYGPQPSGTYQTPDLPPKPQIKKAEVDSDEELSNHMSKLSINKAISRQVKKEIKRLSQHRCSNCGRTGHNSRNCKYKKRRSKNRSKKTGSVNKVTVDSSSEPGSDTDSSDNDSSDNNSDSEETSSESEADINKSKSRKMNKDISTSNKSITLKQNIRQILLEMLEKVLLPHQLEKLKSGDKYLFIPDFTNRRDPIPAIPDSEDEETLDDPMEIDFVQRKRSGYRCYPGANFPIMSEDIAKRLKLVIDTKEKHDLRGIATIPTESLGTTRNVAVDFIPDKYDYDLLASKRELKLVCNGKEYFIPINMHKVKNKLEVNCATASQDDRDGVPLLCNKPLVSDQISQNTNSNESEDNESLEKWHAPAGFSLDSDDSTLKKNA
ncbi:1572_t:CDS:2 [Paraglomus brasilianum]|uniref:1572_t:CDS:1 n=1 Tax=Paraglomus brasilianum TaxID=144538 RepID=A0A9N9DD07_9GLOM|nr:1572_t:CDS:2 [Paraglomus brasilianum]